MLGALVNGALRHLGLRLSRLGDKGSDEPRVRGSVVEGVNVVEGVEYFYERISILRYAPWFADRRFVDAYQAIEDHTLVDVYRCYELWDLVREVRDVDGDILEVGVWRGGTGALLATAAKVWKPSATVFLADTFAGVVKAGSLDDAYKGGEHADTSVEIVEGLLNQMSLRNYKIVQGVFPEDVTSTFSATTIALCHIDVDVYESALDIVDWVSSRLSSRGVIVFDDYGFLACPGITRLVNELRGSTDWDFIYNINGHAILRRR